MEYDHIRTDGGIPTTTDLYGQVAVAGGGTDGIGKAIATRLADYGATTVLVGNTPDRGRTAAREIATEIANVDY